THGLDLDIRLADAPEEAAGAMERLGAADLVLVDTPALDPGDAPGTEQLAALLEAVAPDEMHLVLPASLAASPAAEAIAALQTAARVDRVILTRLDGWTQSGAVGAAVAAARPFSYVARGTRADGGIAPADAL